MRYRNRSAVPFSFDTSQATVHCLLVSSSRVLQNIRRDSAHHLPPLKNACSSWRRQKILRVDLLQRVRLGVTDTPSPARPVRVPALNAQTAVQAANVLAQRVARLTRHEAGAFHFLLFGQLAWSVGLAHWKRRVPSPSGRCGRRRALASRWSLLVAGEISAICRECHFWHD